MPNAKLSMFLPISVTYFFIQDCCFIIFVRQYDTLRVINLYRKCVFISFFFQHCSYIILVRRNESRNPKSYELVSERRRKKRTRI